MIPEIQSVCAAYQSHEGCQPHLKTDTKAAIEDSEMILENCVDWEFLSTLNKLASCEKREPQLKTDWPVGRPEREGVSWLMADVAGALPTFS